MISKTSIGRVVGVCTAAIYGSFIMIGVHDFWPNMSTLAMILLAGAVCVVLYLAGRWIAARKELNKRLPISSKELRRRRKEFYEGLNLHGRPQSGPRSRPHR